MKKIGITLALLASVAIVSPCNVMARPKSSGSFSHSSGRSLFGTTTRSSGLQSVFTPKTPQSNSAFGRTASQNQGNSIFNNFFSKKTATAAAVGAGVGAANSTPSDKKNYTQPNYGNGHYSQPVTASVPTSPSTPQTVIVHHDHYHDDGGGSFMNGVVMGSILSHHDDRPVIVNNAPAQAVPVQNNPMAYNTAPQQVPASVQPVGEHHSHWFLWSILGIAFIGGGLALAYHLRKGQRNRSLVENAIDVGVKKFENKDKPIQQDMDCFDNPLGVKIPVKGTTGKGSVIGIDLDVRVQTMSATGFFPQITGKTFLVSGYSRMEPKGAFSGLILERIYLEDDSMFLQMVLNEEGDIQETTLYTTIEADQMSDDEVQKMADGNGRFNQKSLTVQDKNGNDVTYTRVVHPDTETVNMIDAEEDIMSPEGTDVNMHKMMVFERSHGNQSEYLMPDVRYAENEDGSIENYAFTLAIGIPVNNGSVHAY